MKKYSVLTIVTLCVITCLMSTGCKLKAPLNATKLEIGGEMVYGVLEAWKDA